MNLKSDFHITGQQMETHPEYSFSFTIEDRFVHFTINCNNFSNQGYGTALMSIMFDIVNTNYNYVDFICGRLSTADYYNGNWNMLKTFPMDILFTEFLNMNYP